MLLHSNNSLKVINYKKSIQDFNSEAFGFVVPKIIPDRGSL